MKRILIIDDDDIFRKMLQHMLENAGYEVEEAPDGMKGIKLLKDTPFDLIITDIFMPGKEGIETIIELKRDYPEVKIIAMSGGGMRGNVDFLDIAKDLGAEYSLEKPFGKEEILDAIKKVLADVHEDLS